tara:strand:+ start:5043 stop:10022 length:4980 start_codon:yes stop_codon:yes gene_type:complete
MKAVLQLYIEGTRIDLFEDESISIVQSIQNVRDISKVFVDFTRTFNVPASKTNNKIFKHFYNYTITDGFDGRLKKSATIEINHRPYKTGKIKLNGVDLKDGVPSQYRITFFGNTIDLNDLLGDDNLSSLELSDFDKTYNATTVQQLLEGAPANTTVTYSHPDRTTDIVYPRGIIAPLITHTTRLFYGSSTTEYPDAAGGNLNTGATGHHGVYYEELKYAIPVDAVIRAIEDKYGLTFSNDFFVTTNDRYYDLFLWLHRKKGKAFEEEAVEKRITNFLIDYYQEIAEVGSFGDRIVVQNATGLIDFSVTLVASSAFSGKVYIKENGNIRDDLSKTVTSQTSVSINGYLTNGTYEVFVESSDSSIAFTTDSQWNLDPLYVPDSAATYAMQSGGFTFNNTRTFTVSSQIPDMKIIDFLTGIFKMFNLTAYTENGTIVVKTLDNYYGNSGFGNTAIDITNYVDEQEASVDAALPYKEVDLKYEGLGTKLAKQHEQLSNTGWGTEEYRGDDYYDASPETYEVVLPFEHMKFERLKDGSSNTSAQVGWFVDDNNDPYFGSPLIFYAYRQTSATAIKFLTGETSGSNNITSYFIPSNSPDIDPTESEFAINFKQEINEYTQLSNFTKTLFNEYYDQYISDVFKLNRRLTTVHAYLPIKILQELELSNILTIGYKNYKINEIETDFSTGRSRIELLNQRAVSAFGSTPISITDPTDSDACTADSTLETVDATSPTADTTCDLGRSLEITGPLTAEKNVNITLTANPKEFIGTAEYLWAGGAAAGETTKEVTITNADIGNVTYTCTATDDSDDEEFPDTHIVLWTPKKYTITLNIVNNITGSASGYNITGNQDGDTLELEEGETYSFNTVVEPNDNYQFTTGPVIENAQGVVGTSDQTVNTTLSGNVQLLSEYVEITGPTQKTINNDVPLGAYVVGFTATSYTWSGGSLSNDDCVDPDECTQVLFTETSAGEYTYTLQVSDGTTTYTDTHTIIWSTVTLIDITLAIDTSNLTASGFSNVNDGFTLTGDLAGLVKTQNAGTVFSFTTGIELNPGYEYVSGAPTIDNAGGTYTTSQTVTTTFGAATIRLIVYNYYVVTGCAGESVAGQTIYVRSRDTFTVGSSTTGTYIKIGNECYYTSATAFETDWATNNGITVGDGEGIGCSTCTDVTTVDPCLTTKSRFYLRYSTSSNVCESAQTKAFYWINGADVAQTQANFCNATNLYTPSDCTVNAPAGYYSLDLDNKVRRYWNGSSFDVCVNCIDAQSLIYLGTGWNPINQYCDTASGVQGFYYFDNNATLTSATTSEYLYDTAADVGTTNYAATGFYTDGTSYRYFDPAEEVWIDGGSCPIKPDPPACTAPTKPTLSVWREYLECDGDSEITLGNDSAGGFPQVVKNRTTGVCYELQGTGSGNQDNDWVEERTCNSDNILVYTWISFDICSDCTGNQYYALRKCSDNSSGYRSDQTTSAISLDVNDRVTDLLSETYIVVGTTGSSATNVGTITDTGFVNCPGTTRPDNVFVVERQSDSFTTYVQLESGFTIGDTNITISTDGSNCYDITGQASVLDPTVYGVITGSCTTTTTTTTTTTVTCGSQTLYTSLVSAEDVCCNVAISKTVYMDANDISTATKIYTNDTCSSFVGSNAFYTADFSNYYQWNATTNTLTGPTSCPTCP